jgi:GntR family transcriptional regulator
MSLDAAPVELVSLYCPVELAAGTPLAENRRIAGGTPRVLAELGHAPGRAVEQVGTRLATVEEFVTLRLPEVMPILRQFRVVYDTADRPVEVQVLIKAGHKYELQYELPASSEES